MNKVCLAFIIATTCWTVSGSSKLVGVLQFLRHGARSASFEPYDDSLDTKLTKQYLTTVGIRQHYHVGKFTRQKYSSILAGTYSEKKVKVFSSSKERCLVSADSFTRGLFDLGSGQKLTSNEKADSLPPLQYDFASELNGLSSAEALPKNYQPIPISSYSEPFSNKLFQGLSQCKPMKEHIVKFYNELNKKYDVFFEPTFAILSKSGFNSKRIFRDAKFNFLDALKICDFVLANTYSDPKSKVTPEEVEHCFFVKSINNYSRYKDPQILGWVLGSLYSIISPYLDQVAEGTHKETLLTLVAHQRDLGALIYLIKPDIIECFEDIYKQKFVDKSDKVKENCMLIIKFASSLNFEISETTEGKRYVNAFFQNKQINICETGQCEISTFIDLYNSKADKDWWKLCEFEPVHFVEKPLKIIEISLWVTAGLAFLAFIILMFVIYGPSNKEPIEKKDDIEAQLQPNETVAADQ